MLLDPVESELVALRRKANLSWAHLRRGCSTCWALRCLPSSKGWWPVRAYAREGIGSDSAGLSRTA